MTYRNGTYIAFDGNGTTNPTEGDLKYYGILQAWNKETKFDFQFSDSHKKTYQCRDESKEETIKKRLLERMKNSKNMLIIISNDTNWDRGLLNYEVEKAIDYYELPLIVAYTGYEKILNPSLLNNLWPKALKDNIVNETVKCIHIPFKQKIIFDAISRFTVHSKMDENILNSSLSFYNSQAYEYFEKK